MSRRPSSRSLIAKFAAAGLGIAALGTTAAVLTAGDDAPDESLAATAIGIDLDASAGIAPISEVVSFFERRAGDRPNDFLTRVELSRALATQARHTADLDLYAAAEQVAREAVELGPDHVPARIELAAALQAQHRFTEALHIGEQIAVEEPSSTDAVFVVSDAHFELGNYELAADGYRRLAAAGRDAAVVSREARLAAARGDNDDAVQLALEAEALSSAYSLRPNGRAFYPFQLGHFRFEAGDVAGAIDALERALTIDPSHAGATERLASIRAAAGQLPEAIELYEQLIADGPAADLHGSLADLLRATGDIDGADEQEALGLALAEATIESHPAERRHLTGFYFSRDPQTALQLAETELLERRDVGGYDTLAWALHLNGRHADAQTAIDTALAIGTDTATIRYHAGAIAAANGDVDAAIEHLDAALAINSQFAFGDADDARQLLQELRG